MTPSILKLKLARLFTQTDKHSDTEECRQTDIHVRSEIRERENERWRAAKRTVLSWFQTAKSGVLFRH